MISTHHILTALTFFMVTVSMSIAALGIFSLAAGNVAAALGCVVMASITARLAYTVR